MHTSDTPLLVGQSAAITDLRHAIARVARGDSKVLITGESGTGKEIVARQIYAFSPRADRPFITVNCGGLTDTLLESELFGHVQGSFTGAHRDRPGKLELADTGTVFLDEVGETTPRMQGLLLRLLETGEIQKVGARDQALHVDVRTLAATNRSLRDLVTQGMFRSDLYYRLNVIHLAVPALRDRPEDVPALVHHFLHGHRMAESGSPMTVTADAMARLVAHSWPGNVRELRNVIERIAVRGRSHVITADDVAQHLQLGAEAPPAVPEPGDATATALFRRMIVDQQPFWTTVYPLFMQRDISRDVVRAVVRRGLQEARGNYKVVVRMFNMDPDKYKKFLNFLRKHQCQPSFKEFRH